MLQAGVNLLFAATYSAASVATSVIATGVEIIGEEMKAHKRAEEKRKSVNRETFVQGEFNQRIENACLLLAAYSLRIKIDHDADVAAKIFSTIASATFSFNPFAAPFITAFVYWLSYRLCADYLARREDINEQNRALAKFLRNQFMGNPDDPNDARIQYLSDLPSPELEKITGQLEQVVSDAETISKSNADKLCMFGAFLGAAVSSADGFGLFWRTIVTFGASFFIGRGYFSLWKEMPPPRVLTNDNCIANLSNFVNTQSPIL